MSEPVVRKLTESEHRSAWELFHASLLRPAPDDKRWDSVKARWETGRVFGGFVDDMLSGSAMSFPSTLAVPGGQAIPAACVSGVGVRADQTRRGLLTALMRAQLADLYDRGEVAAMLHASEAGIYGRFGYGVATRGKRLSLYRAHARIRPEVPSSGSVRIVDSDNVPKQLPQIYERMGLHRPGMIDRPPAWWDYLSTVEHVVTAVHTSGDGVDDGYVQYRAKSSDFRFEDGKTTVYVLDFEVASPEAWAGLWRFLLSLDLADELLLSDRPLDERVELLLVDGRACWMKGTSDDLWLRLVDVPAALAARSYGDAPPVVLEVRDTFLPENSGNYQISSEGATRTSHAAQLSMDADTLAALYLGDTAVSTMASVGRVTVAEHSLKRADLLFATTDVPWCGTNF